MIISWETHSFKPNQIFLAFEHNSFLAPISNCSDNFYRNYKNPTKYSNK